MPELPEVETTRRGIEPWLVGRRIDALELRERRLRWPVPRSLPAKLAGARIRAVERRAKYLLVRTDAGTLILHLGMSGSLRVLDAGSPPLAHDHFDLVLDSGRRLRFNDPRRFGCLLFTAGDPARHPLLAGLAVEPLSAEFTGELLWRRARGRRVAIKLFILDSRNVAGVGNIYASEALFRARLRPRRGGSLATLGNRPPTAAENPCAPTVFTHHDLQNLCSTTGSMPSQLTFVVLKGFRVAIPVSPLIILGT